MSEKTLKDLSSELSKINKELNKTNDGKKKGIKELEVKELNNVLEALYKSLDLVKAMMEKGEDNCPKVKDLEDRTRVLEDQSDYHHQRSLKGKFMISSLKDNNIISKEKKLKEEGKSLPQYVTELVFGKLGVTMGVEEIVSCHHTSSGLVFRLGDFKPSSNFNQIVNAIKCGFGKETKNIFINFALTPRRASLLYEVRQLKKAKKISKFYTAFDGSITVVKEEGTKKKEKVTDIVEKEEGAAGGQEKRGARAKGGQRMQPRTLTVEELRERFGGQV